MAAFNSYCIIVIVYFLHSISYIHCGWKHVKPTGFLTKRSVGELVIDSLRRIDEIEYIKQDNINYAAFEIGYIVQIIQNKYRKMVDRLIISTKLNKISIGYLFVYELVLYLDEIETGYWQIEHLLNMLHEVERKYHITSSLNETYRDKTKTEEEHDRLILDAAAKNRSEYGEKSKNPTRKTIQRQMKEKKELEKHLRHLDKVKKMVHDYTYVKKSMSKWWLPVDYGWELDKA